MLVQEVLIIKMFYYFIIANMIFELKLSMILYDNTLVHEMLITMMFYYFIIAIIISELKFNIISELKFNMILY